MDTSETYIKMCEEAKEIQDGHKWSVGDYFVSRGFTDIVIVTKSQFHNSAFILDVSYLTWLPQQDDLQEMYGSYDECIEALYWWNECASVGKSKNYWGYDSGAFTSMEQLWLAFYMHETHNKVWDGEGWK